MKAGQLIVACDFGTTEFRALVTETTERGTLRVLGCGRVPAVGYQDGDFVDLRTGSRYIARTIRAVEAAADVDISAFYYNIAGSHLRAVKATAQMQVGPGPRAIRNEDVAAVLEKARSLVIPFDNYILAVNPVSYAVDRVRGIVDPAGRLGSQLEVEALLITGSHSVVRNVEHAIGHAGYEVAGRAVDVLASAALLTPEERQDGVLLVDVGGHVTHWALFRNDRLVGLGQVPWAGHHLTADLAHGLRRSLEEAEEIKRDRGVVLRGLHAEIDPVTLFGEAEPEETPGLVAAILEPRMEEIFSLVKRDLPDDRDLPRLGAGIVLTGGGSRCEGTARLCEEVFGLPVRRRHVPPGLEGEDILEPGQWATAAGLSLWAAGQQEPSPRPLEDVALRAPRLWQRVRGWFGGSEREHENVAVAE
jgi:cell division protein FtsA